MPTDLSVQADLMADLNAAQAAAGARRIEAKAKRQEAWRAFETAIYGDASEPPALEDEVDPADVEAEDV